MHQEVEIGAEDLDPAIEKGMTVWSVGPVAPSLPSTVCPPSTVHRLQKTVSQVSQKSSSWLGWLEHLGTTSFLCLAIKSSSWFTRKEGGKAATPPPGIVIRSLHIGHRN